MVNVHEGLLFKIHIQSVCFLFLLSYELNFMTSKPGPGVYTINIRSDDVSNCEVVHVVIVDSKGDGM